MKCNNDLDVIREVIKNYLCKNGKYNLFLIKSSFFQTESYDIGIDCAFDLNPKQKLKIINEINRRIRSNHLFLIDFSMINNDLKECMYENCELIT